MGAMLGRGRDLVFDVERLCVLRHKDLGHDGGQGGAQGRRLVRGILQVLRHRIEKRDEALVDDGEPAVHRLLGGPQLGVWRPEHAAHPGSALRPEVVQLDLQHVVLLTEELLQLLEPLGSLPGQHRVHPSPHPAGRG